jgi:hypothetical protein
MLANFQYTRVPRLRYAEPYLIRRPLRYSLTNVKSAIRDLTRVHVPVRDVTRAQLPVDSLARAKVPIYHSYVSYIPVTGAAKFS